MLCNNVTQQISILRASGSILRFFDNLLNRGINRYHPLGFGLFSQLLGDSIFNSENRAFIYLDPPQNNKLSFYLNDRYWSSLVIPGNIYEKEIHPILDKVLTSETYFIDCGANIGYWSVFARKYLPARNIIAIEAYPPTFMQLQKNSDLNGGFQCILAGVSDKDGDEVWLGGSHHSTMSLLKEPGDYDLGSWVNTITLNEIYNTYIPAEAKRIVIKLDIEGMETRVLDHARDILKCNPLIIYEDHGKDKNSDASRFIQDVLGYNLYFWDHLQGLQRVNIEAIKKIKHSRRVGYNFLACHPQAEFWFENLSSSLSNMNLRIEMF